MARRGWSGVPPSSFRVETEAAGYRTRRCGLDLCGQHPIRTSEPCSADSTPRLARTFWSTPIMGLFDRLLGAVNRQRPAGRPLPHAGAGPLRPRPSPRRGTTSSDHPRLLPLRLVHGGRAEGHHQDLRRRGGAALQLRLLDEPSHYNLLIGPAAHRSPAARLRLRVLQGGLLQLQRAPRRGGNRVRQDRAIALDPGLSCGTSSATRPTRGCRCRC